MLFSYFYCIIYILIEYFILYTSYIIYFYYTIYLSILYYLFLFYYFRDPALSGLPDSPKVDVFTPSADDDDDSIVEIPTTNALHNGGGRSTTPEQSTSQRHSRAKQHLVRTAPPVTSPASTVPPVNGGQSIVMLHVDRSGGAYLIPASQMSAAKPEAVFPVNLTSNVQHTYNIQQENSSAVSAASATAPSPLTLAKMVSHQSVSSHRPVHHRRHQDVPTPPPPIILSPPTRPPHHHRMSQHSFLTTTNQSSASSPDLMPIFKISVRTHTNSALR